MMDQEHTLLEWAFVQVLCLFVSDLQIPLIKLNKQTDERQECSFNWKSYL